MWRRHEVAEINGFQLGPSERGGGDVREAVRIDLLNGRGRTRLSRSRYWMGCAGAIGTP